jgi:hypothetical protein
VDANGKPTDPLSVTTDAAGVAWASVKATSAGVVTFIFKLKNADGKTQSWSFTVNIGK